MRPIKKRQHAALSLPTLRLEGSLFLPDQLEKAALGQASQQSEADYHTPKGLKLKDDYSRAFQIASAQWKHFAPHLERQDTDAASITAAFVHELLRDAFGYHNLAPSAGITIGERQYPISLLAGDALPVVIAPHTLGLDEADPCFAIVGSGSRKKSAFQLAQEFLNASSNHLWALVSNGKQLRLLRDADTLTRPSFLEFDLQDLLGGQRFAEFAMVWRLLHASRAGVSPGSAPGACVWETWRANGQQEGTRVRDGLRQGVTAALLTLGTGFLQHPANEALRQDLLQGRLHKEAYFQQLLRLVYRLIFLFTVEERGVLHAADDSKAAIAARRAYAEGYALARLRERSLRRRARTRFDDLWQSVRIVFRGLANGEPRLALPALGGLFAHTQCAALDNASLSNAHLLEAVKNLRWASADGTLAPVDYRNMGPEELGSVYESLLELVPEVDISARQFGFVGLTSEGSTPESTRGNARKTSGSYYTPDSLVQELIKSALDPIIEQRVRDNPANPTEALLSIKVVDPACGSGHFLLAAARRLAERLAALRATDGAVKPQDYRHALREVIARCIFGVDRNPMALELARTALWLEGFEEGKPLSFLDHHLQCGDALIGLTDLKQLTQGIPSDAFKALSGDDKTVCRTLARENRDGVSAIIAANQQGQLPLALESTGDLTALQTLEAMPDTTPADIAAKEATYATVLQRARDNRLGHAANLFVGAVLAPKADPAALEQTPTSRNLYLALYTDQAPEQLAEAKQPTRIAAAQQRCRDAHVLHWPLAFPHIFAKGGFDCVLGNPPWDIVQARDADTNENQLAREKLWFGEGIYNILSGRRDLYKLFLALAPHLLTSGGRCGFVVPVGFMFEDDCAALRKTLFDRLSVTTLLHIQNAQKSFFPDVHASYRFVAVCLAKARLDLHRFSTVVKSPSDLASPHWYNVHRNQFDSILGEERSAVLFPDIAQADLHQSLSSRLRERPLLIYRIVAEFHATSDKSMLAAQRESKTDWTLLKNGSFHHYHPCFGPTEKFVSCSVVKERLIRKQLDPDRWMSRSRLVFRDIARNDDSRTLIACLVPSGFVSTYDAPMLVPIDDDQQAESALAFYAGYLTSFLADFLVRPFVDKHIKGYVLARVPIPKYDPTVALMDKAARISLMLAQNSWQACHRGDSPAAFERTGPDRLLLDAIYLRLARTNRSEAALLFESFASVRADEIQRFGEYRTRRLVLEAWDNLERGALITKRQGAST